MGGVLRNPGVTGGAIDWLAIHPDRIGTGVMPRSGWFVLEANVRSLSKASEEFVPIPADRTPCGSGRLIRSSGHVVQRNGSPRECS
jgi:hypothetical protein